ncbi:MAG: hypothetical protein M3Q85_01765 [Acidobacteriota bacterium]|nr:hypothetical protein [Acidobacteriota bacterium]
MSHRLTPFLGLAVVTLAVCPAVLAQTAPPTLQRVSPSGAQRGTRVSLTVEGTNIAGATRFIFSEPGFSASNIAVKELPVEKPMTPKGVVRTDAPIEDKARRYQVTADLSIAPGVPHAVHAFRIETPIGVSNLLRFAVSSLAEIVEEEPNGPDAAQKVTLPAVLVGSLGVAGDVDAYEFRARTGEEMVFQVVARPLGSRLDSIVRLLNGDGKLLGSSNDVDLSRDAVLTWRFTETGTYRVTVEDVEHGGGANGFAYRVHAGPLPYLTGLFPLGIATGSTAEIAATGVNLGATSVRRIAGDRSAVVGRTIPLPASTPAGSALNRKALALGSYPEALEAEPNDESAVAQALAIPSTVNGRIWRPEPPAGGGTALPDTDVYRFTARKGQKIVLDVTAQQLGSPLDSIIEVLDAAGQLVPRAAIRCVAQTEIALNDPDSDRRSMRLTTWNGFAINDHLLIGDELLQIAALPTHPDDDVQLMRHRSGRLTLLDTSARNHSVGEAVYKVEIHPPGTRFEPNGLPAYRIGYVNDDGGVRFGGKDSRLHFEAPADGDYFVRIGDVRGLEGERYAYRLTVREPAPDFEVAFDPKSFNLPKGGRVSVNVTADRKDGFDGPIEVELQDLPPGLTATSARIPAGAATTVLMLAAAADASFQGQKASLPSMHPPLPGTSAAPAHDIPGLIALTLVGRGTIDGRPVSRTAETTEPISVVALTPQPDLVVTTDASRIELAPGRAVTLTVTIERHNGFTGRVPVSVMNLPHGVRVDDVGLNGVMITEQETSRVVHIVAEPWVQTQTQPLIIVGRVEVNSPIRNEAAALPVDLVVTAPAAASR